MFHIESDLATMMLPSSLAYWHNGIAPFAKVQPQERKKQFCMRLAGYSSCHRACLPVCLRG